MHTICPATAAHKSPPLLCATSPAAHPATALSQPLTAPPPCSSARTPPLQSQSTARSRCFTREDREGRGDGENRGDRADRGELVLLEADWRDGVWWPPPLAGLVASRPWDGSHRLGKLSSQQPAGKLSTTPGAHANAAAHLLSPTQCKSLISTSAYACRLPSLRSTASCGGRAQQCLGHQQGKCQPGPAADPAAAV